MHGFPAGENVKNIRAQFGQTLVDLGEKYSNMVVLTADLMYPTKTDKFASTYPDRFFDVGIAEQDLFGISSGLASSGKLVFACSYANFSCLRAGEHIRNDIAYTKFNVKVCALSSGLTFGVGGPSHQSYEDVSVMRALPNFVVMVPSDAMEVDKAVKAAAEHEGPVYLRLGRDEEFVVNEKDYEFKIGKAVRLRDGDDVTIIANGPMVYEAVKASDMLRDQGINARVLNMHTIKPFDKEAVLHAAKTTKGIVVVEEHNVIGGLGSSVLEALEGGHACPVVRIGIPDVFPIIGPTWELRKYYGLHHENVAKKVRELLKI